MAPLFNSGNCNKMKEFIITSSCLRMKGMIPIDRIDKVKERD